MSYVARNLGAPSQASLYAPYNPALWVNSDVVNAPDVAIPPAPLPAIVTAIPPAEVMPTVSPSTLLAAASLPGAPSPVTQAAEQYRRQNPMQTFLQSIPLVGWLAGGALLLLMFAGGRR